MIFRISQMYIVHFMIDDCMVHRSKDIYFQ